jgi:competence protein ComEC
MTGIVAGTAALIGAALGWWGAVVVVLLAVLMLAISSRRLPWAVCAIAVVAVIVAAWRAETRPPPSEFGEFFPSPQLGVVVTAPVTTGQRQQFAVEPSLDAGLPTAGGIPRVCVTADPVPIVRLGDDVRLRGATKRAADLSMDQRAAISTRGCMASLYATSIQVISSSPSPRRALADLRTRLGAVLRRSAPGDAGVLLSGLVTGDDDGFSSERKTAFIRTGTTHLTAVSGSNLALVAGILATVGGATIGRHRALWHVVTIFAIWGYAFVSGSQPPSLRAAIVATAAVLAFRIGRRPDFVTLIVLAAGAMVVVEPRQIESLGFRLSVAASLALVLVLTGLMATDRLSRFGVVLTATVAAQLATLPVLLPAFGTVSLISVPANIVAVPLVAITMPLAALAAIAGSIWLPLGEAIAAPAALIATALLRVIDELSARDAYVQFGVPPLPAAVAIASAVAILLLLIGGNELRELVRTSIKSAAKSGSPPEPQTTWRRYADPRGQTPATIDRIPLASGVAPLPSSASVIVTREDPLDTLAADLDEAEEEPAGQEVGHELADKRQIGEAVPGEVVGQLPGAHSAEEPEHTHQEQQNEHEHLTAPAHHGDIFAAKVIES